MRVRCRIPALLVLLVFLAGCVLVHEVPVVATTFSVMTWNVRGYPESTSERRSWFSDVLEEYQADILCIQEIANADRVNSFLASEAFYVTAAFLDSSDGQDNAIFFGDSFDAVLDLADPDGFIHPAQLAYFHFGEFDAYILTVHLAWSDVAQRAAERTRLEEVAAALTQLDPDLIVAGDFNTTGGSGDTIEDLAVAMGLTVLYPTNEAGTTCAGSHYDYVLVSPSIAVSWDPTAEVITFDDEDTACAVSDHRPVIARFGDVATPEAEPGTQTEPEPQQVGLIINELELNPPGEDSGAEWIELHNSSTVAVSVAGWHISYTSYCSCGPCQCWEPLLPQDIPAGGYLVFVFPKRRLHNENGWAICLRDSAGSVVDETPPGMTDDDNDLATWQRVPNGSGGWQWVSRLETRGGPN